MAILFSYPSHILLICVAGSLRSQAFLAGWFGYLLARMSLDKFGHRLGHCRRIIYFMETQLVQGDTAKVCKRTCVLVPHSLPVSST